MNKIFTCIAFSLCTLCLCGVIQAQSTTVSLAAAKDNSIHSENNNSNAKGIFLFTGQTAAMNNGALRRALIQFDLSEIPADATITAAELKITGSKQSSDNVSIHRLLADWGEGTSEATGQQGRGAAPSSDDATWNFSFFDQTPWTTAGGDFVDQASATTSVANQQESIWSGDGVVADVQAWLSGEADNFGWIIVGDETADGTAVRMVSRESDMAAPELVITYDVLTNAKNILTSVSDLKVYPSIVDSELFVETTTNSALDGSIQILDILGRSHIQFDVAYAAHGNYKESINVANLIAGTYLVRLEDAGRTITRKIIIE